jgi:hypothetical protein
VANKIQAILHLERCNAKDFAFGDCRIQKIMIEAVESKRFLIEGQSGQKILRLRLLNAKHFDRF